MFTRHQPQSSPYCRFVTDPETRQELVVAVLVSWPKGTILGAGIGKTHREAVTAVRLESGPSD